MNELSVEVKEEGDGGGGRGWEGGPTWQWRRGSSIRRPAAVGSRRARYISFSSRRYLGFLASYIRTVRLGESRLSSLTIVTIAFFDAFGPRWHAQVIGDGGKERGRELAGIS